MGAALRGHGPHDRDRVTPTPDGQVQRTGPVHAAIGDHFDEGHVAGRDGAGLVQDDRVSIDRYMTGVRSRDCPTLAAYRDW